MLFFTANFLWPKVKPFCLCMGCMHEMNERNVPPKMLFIKPNRRHFKTTSKPDTKNHKEKCNKHKNIEVFWAIINSNSWQKKKKWTQTNQFMSEKKVKWSLIAQQHKVTTNKKVFLKNDHNLPINLESLKHLQALSANQTFNSCSILLIDEHANHFHRNFISVLLPCFALHRARCLLN